VAGLGNPGRQYAGTRHNAGFEVVERLAEKLGWCPPGDFDRLARDKFDALMLEGPFPRPSGDFKLVLLKPTTFMNRSGEALQKAARFYKVAAPDMLVVVDELALPIGRIRLRASGSDGGHNGLRDVRRALGTDDYPRLRIGIDPPPEGFEGRDYVLGKYTPEQRRAADEAVVRAADCCLAWLKEGVETAMNRFNAGQAGGL
jgi:PTH1 family peptidyl-tRNA hydrolase